MAERSSALDSSSDVVRMCVRIPAWPVAALVSLSKTLNHNCFVLRMGRKAVGPVCCVMHVKEPRTLIVKEKELAPVFLDSRLEHPAGWICARYKSSVLTTCIIIINYTLLVIWCKVEDIIKHPFIQMISQIMVILLRCKFYVETNTTKFNTFSLMEYAETLSRGSYKVWMELDAILDLSYGNWKLKF